MDITRWLEGLGLDQYEHAFREGDVDAAVLPELTADDLIALGFKPGPEFGEILEAVETRQLEGALRSREEAIEWVKREHSLGRKN